MHRCYHISNSRSAKTSWTKSNKPMLCGQNNHSGNGNIFPSPRRVTIYHYQGCRYEWDPEHTKVLEHADVHQLIALTFCKVYLTRFLQLSFKAQRTWVRNIERGQSTCLHSTDLDDRLLQTSFTEVNIEPHYTIHRRLSPGQQLPTWHHEWDQFRWALFWSFLWIILIVTIIHIHHKDHSFYTHATVTWIHTCMNSALTTHTPHPPFSH